jgi:hypothetical protein
MSVPLHRINYILKFETDRLKSTIIGEKKLIIYSIHLDDKISLSLEGKTKKLVDQVIYESIAQIAIGREKRDRKIAEDITPDLFTDDGSKEIVWNSQLRFSS